MEHQLHHVGRLAIISHLSGAVVALFAAGERVDPWHWETFSQFRQLAEATVTHNRACPCTIYYLKPAAPAAQMTNEFVALAAYAQEYTTFPKGPSPRLRRQIQYLASV